MRIVLTIVMSSIGSMSVSSVSIAAAEPAAVIANEAFARGDANAALPHADAAVAADPENSSVRLLRAQILLELRRHSDAIGDLDLVIESAGDEASSATVSALYLRGRARFCGGNPTGSVADFDAAIAADESLAPRLWERGISLYYAGRFAEGAAQFAAYQQYHNADVENIVWRVVCQARADTWQAAQRQIMSLGNKDPRVPMSEIDSLFRGAGTVEQVLAAAEQKATPAQKRQHQFYAHLYLGLYYEAHGETAQARDEILAAEKLEIAHYMWDVAHVHAERIRNEQAKQ